MTTAAPRFQQAEAVARKAAAAAPDPLAPQSFAETQRVLHELRVHQIELEMQNEELRQSEMSLGAARTRYFDLYDLAPVGYCTLDDQGLILEANLTAATLLGVVREGLVKQPFHLLVFPADQDHYYLCRETLAATGALRACELRMVKADGTTFWAHLDVTDATDAGGGPECRVVIHDVTEFKLAGEALRLKNLVFDESLAANSIADLHGVITEANAAFLRIHGYARRAEVVGKNLADFINDPQVTAVISATLNETGCWKSDYTAKKRDGSTFVATALATVVREEAGTVIGYQSSIMDISERKRVETALDIERARYFDFYNLSPVGYLTLNNNGIILESNLTAGTVLGVARDGLVKQTFSHYIHKDDLSIYSQCRLRLFKTGTPQTCELRLLKGDGTIVWVHLNTIIVQEGLTDAPVWRMVLSDITESKHSDTYREMGREVLLILNEPENETKIIQRVAALMKTRTGFDAVGIRLKKGDDFPFVAQCGFSAAFLATENTLLRRTADGAASRDADGNACLKCTCGLVLSRKPPSSHPLFTPGGSFWVNNAFALLELPPDQDSLPLPRTCSLRHGYVSLALIPIWHQNEVMGLLYLGDRRQNSFSLERVKLLEGIAIQLGTLLLRKQMERELRENERSLTKAQQVAHLGSWELNDATHELRWSDEAFRILGYAPGAVSPTMALFFQHVHPEDRSFVQAAIASAWESPAPYSADHRIVLPDGKVRFVHEQAEIVHDDDEHPKKWMGTIQDITRQKHAEIALQLSKSRLRQLVVELSRVKEHEQQRLARCLHDEIAQNLALLRMRLGSLAETLVAGPAHAEVTRIRDLLETTLNQTRSLVFDLKPPVLQLFGLAAAVEWAGERLCQDHQLAFVGHNHGEPDQWDEERKVLLFRCARELMVNVVKHAKATQLTTAVEVTDARACVIVEDDGDGFEVSTLDRPTFGAGFGLLSVQERLLAAGGQCAIESTPGVGTRVTLTLPLDGTVIANPPPPHRATNDATRGQKGTPCES